MQTRSVAERIAVADEVRGGMARARVTQTQLAAALGLSQPAISRRLQGKVDFTVSELRDVAAMLGVPISQLLDERSEVAS